MNNPNHEEYEEFRDWIGDDFDPNEFDIEKVNELLQEKNYGCYVID